MMEKSAEKWNIQSPTRTSGTSSLGDLDAFQFNSLGLYFTVIKGPIYFQLRH